jgi:RNA polymerase sigma-70 factor (ECF subfamily)
MQAAAAGVLRRLVGRRDPDYEDLVQSTLAQVLTTLDRKQFRGECAPGGWAAVIARKVAVDLIRSRSRERALFLREGAGDLDVVEAGRVDLRSGPEHLTSVQEEFSRVRDALLALPPQKADVVVLHDLLGHDLTSVARQMRISLAAAQSRLVRGRREILARTRLTPPPRRAPRRSRGAT